jgi:hypothetical protein
MRPVEIVIRKLIKVVDTCITQGDELRVELIRTKRQLREILDDLTPVNPNAPADVKEAFDAANSYLKKP